MKIRKLLKLRKQNDIVKIAFLFIFVGSFVLIMTIINVVKFYGQINESEEYTIKKLDKISERDLENILDMDNVYCVSPSINNIVSIKYYVSVVDMPCVMVSADYIERVFSVECDTNSRTFYVNDFTFEKLRQEMNLNKDSKVISVKYAFAGDEEAEYKNARIVVVEDDLHADELAIYTNDTDLNLQKNAMEFRTIITKHDLDGTLQSDFENQDYFFSDKEALVNWKYNLEIWMLKIKYGIFISAIAIVAGFIMYKRELKLVEQDC